MTTRSPASPKTFLRMIWSIASSASLRAVADGDALALGQPRRLDDDAARRACVTYSSAAVGSVNDRASAVGIACWRISSLANHLSASSCAASLVGPKTFTPVAVDAVRQPRRQRVFRADDDEARSPFCRTNFSIVVEVHRVDRRRCRRPAPCPGCPAAAYSAVTRGDSASFHASACSRPPLPISRTFMCGAATLAMRATAMQSARRAG